MIIIDSSIAAKLFLPNETGFDQVKAIFKKHDEEIEKIVVPDLLFYEVANALATKTHVPESKIVRALNQLVKYNLGIIYPAVEIIIKAATLAKKCHVSVYDAVYAVLAQEKKCNLITADDKFVDQVKLPFVKKLKDYTKVSNFKKI